VEDPEVERHAVVEERLADEEREAENRAPRIALEGGLGDLAERDLLSLADRERLIRLGELVVGLLLDALLDRADDALRLFLLPVDEQPARALGHVAPHEEDGEPEDRAEQERDPPADARREQRLVEQQDRDRRTACGADP